MNRSEKKIVLITGFTLISALISYSLFAILNYQFEQRMAAKDYGEQTTLVRALDMLEYILRAFSYHIAEHSTLGELFKPILWLLNSFQYILLALVLLGLILFIFRKDRPVRLLRFVFGVYLFYRLVYLVNYLSVQALLPIKIGDYTEARASLFSMFLAVVCTFAWAFIFYTALSELRQYTRLKINKRIDRDAVYDEFAVAPKWQRLLNVWADGFVIYLLWIQLMTEVMWMSSQLVTDYKSEIQLLRIVTLVSIFIIQFFYYLLFEGIWGATPGKFLTGTMVTDDDGGRAPFRLIVYRTLWRHVPFDNLSFLGWRGWHDRYSDTWVCKEELVPLDTQVEE